MSNLSTNLKTWGAQGSEYPDGYNYLEDEEPVDAWDNFVVSNVIGDIQSLIDVVNGRLESESGASQPSSPEVGHLLHRTDAPAQGAHEELYYYDGAASAFRRLLVADGDTMDGTLDMGGNAITDETGTVTLAVGASVSGDADVSGALTVGGAATVSGDTTMQGAASVTGEADVAGAALQHEWHSKQEGGTIADGTAVPIGTFELADGETLEVTQAMLTEDGFTASAANGLDLVIVPEGAADSTDTTTILAGDGATHYPDETGAPLASYQNTSGGTQTVMIALDNGGYNAGTGVDTKGYGGFIARTV